MTAASKRLLPRDYDVGYRDRTSQFLSRRAEFRQSTSDYPAGPTSTAELQQGLTSGSPPEHTSPRMEDSLPPDWVRHVDETRRITRVIKDKITTLSRMHKAHVNSTSFVKDTEDAQEIEILTAEIQRLFHDSKASVVRLERVDADARTAGGAEPPDPRIVRNLQRALVTELNNMSRDFRDTQRQYLSELQRMKQQSGAVSFGESEREKEREELNQRRSYLDRGFTEEQVQQLIMNEEAVAMRDAELAAVYRSIVSLHEMFKDLAALVIDQGTLLDRIDYNLEHTHTEVVEANRELERASEYQRKSRFTLIVMILLVLIILALLVLIFRVAL